MTSKTAQLTNSWLSLTFFVARRTLLALFDFHISVWF